MNSPYIYVIVNTTNNHKYVGKSSTGKTNYFGSGVALKKAIQKYGKEVFKKEILEYCVAEELTDREIYWIAKLNTYKGAGYNLTPGGDGWTKGMKHSKATTKKMKQNCGQPGKQKSEETKEKIRQSLADYRESLTQEERKAVYGKGGVKLRGRTKVFTEIHKQNLSKGQTGKPKSPRTPEHLAKLAERHKKKVCQLDEIQGTILATYNSIREAASKTGTPEGGITATCTGRQKTSGGFIWKYA